MDDRLAIAKDIASALISEPSWGEDSYPTYCQLAPVDDEVDEAEPTVMAERIARAALLVADELIRQAAQQTLLPGVVTNVVPAPQGPTFKPSWPAITSVTVVAQETVSFNIDGEYQPPPEDLMRDPSSPFSTQHVSNVLKEQES